jgi:hypothetical protein
MLAGHRLGFHAVVGHRLPFCGGGLSQPACGAARGIPPLIALCDGLSFIPIANPSDGLGPSEVSRAHVLSQFSKMNHSREQWKQKAKQRGDQHRDQRTQIARLTAERNRATNARKQPQARLRQREAGRHGLATLPKVDVVDVALPLFLVARLSFRAVCRVLSLLASTLGIHKAPGPQTVIHWVVRLTIVRLDAARPLRGWPVSQAPLSNGLMWMIEISIGLGSGKILAVLAVDAHHHRRSPGAPSRKHARGIGVSVADAWPGDTIAELLRRLIARGGRPTAYRKDGGSEWQKAVAFLDDKGRASPCIDDSSHAAAGMLKRDYQQHPAFESFVSACGRVSGMLTHTLLACLAPPSVRTKARFLPVHRLFTWADRVLTLSPPGGAKRGSI